MANLEMNKMIPNMEPLQADEWDSRSREECAPEPSQERNWADPGSNPLFNNLLKSVCTSELQTFDG